MNLATFNPGTVADNRAAQIELAALGLYNGAIDGLWGPKSQSALLAWRARSAVHSMMASSFADQADLDAYHEAKAAGHSEEYALSVGDNGIGEFGRVTAQDHTPMVALHSSDMLDTFGGIQASAHKPITLTLNGHTFAATVEDRCGERGRIDTNPACANIAGLTPPYLVKCTWQAI